jgi:hypothetical protein
MKVIELLERLMDLHVDDEMEVEVLGSGYDEVTFFPLETIEVVDGTVRLSAREIGQ